MNDICKTITMTVIIQENGIIRRESDDYLIGRLANGIKFADMSSVSKNIEKDRITELYSELIMAVESKYPDESRHETALMCIQEREKRLKAMRIGNGEVKK